MEIAGQVAVVTGGASGLGAATARALAEGGARVAVVDFNLAGAEAVASAIGGIAVQCDVAGADSAATAFGRIAATLGPARILVNCAGIAPAKRIVGRNGVMPLDDFARVIAVNLTGTFNMLRLFAETAGTLDPLPTGERGVAINTASVAAFEGQIGQAAYAASKGGVAALTLPAARELAGRGIRVMTIAPGVFETPMLTGMPEQVQQDLIADVPFPHRLGKAEEYAALALHILANPMLNGTVIRLDAALRMR